MAGRPPSCCGVLDDGQTADRQPLRPSPARALSCGTCILPRTSILPSARPKPAPLCHLSPQQGPLRPTLAEGPLHHLHYDASARRLCGPLRCRAAFARPQPTTTSPCHNLPWPRLALPRPTARTQGSEFHEGEGARPSRRTVEEAPSSQRRASSRSVRL